MAFVDWIASTLMSNQFLVGGIGTLAFGSVMYVMRALPEAMLKIVERTVWTQVQIESLSNEYRDVDSFIEGRRFGVFSRSLELKDGVLKTGFGHGWGRYDGTVFRYSKSKSTQQIAPFETLSLSFFTRERAVVERFMRDARPDEHKNTVSVSLLTAAGSVGSLRRRKRDLATVFVDPAIKDRLVQRFTWFLGAEQWHADRGIPWKFGVVLHGPPGTGKTSLIHGLASRFDFNIKYIKSLHGLGAAFLSGTKNDLFVIEDIDTIHGNSSRALPDEATMSPGDGSQHGSALHEILNAMDGLQTPDGVKFIVTTNWIAKLDPALVRPGRIDEVIEIGPLSIDCARRMFMAFYGRSGITGYAPRTGAQLQYMFSTLTAEEAERALEFNAQHGATGQRYPQMD